MVCGTKQTVDSSSQNCERKKNAVQIRNEFRGETGLLQLLLELSSLISTSGMNGDVVPATKQIQCRDSQQEETVGAQHSGHFEEGLIVARDATVVNDIKGSHQIKGL